MARLRGTTAGGYGSVAMDDDDGGVPMNEFVGERGSYQNGESKGATKQPKKRYFSTHIRINGASDADVRQHSVAGATFHAPFPRP